MKFIYYLLIIMVGALMQQSCTCSKSESTFVYLVRHADKGGKDSLSLEGIERSIKLKHQLANSQINTVFSTNYNRTKDTAYPLAKELRKDIEFYNPKELEAFANNLSKEHIGKRILVVGHSNTTPSLVNLLLKEERLEQIHESEYDKLYLVILNQCGESELIEMEYGSESPKSE